MNVTQGLQSLLAVFAVAAVTPVIAAALPGPRIPQVVFFLLGGIVIGPHALGVADTGSVQLVATALARKGGAQDAPEPPEAAEVTPQARHPLDNLLPWHR